MLALLVKQELSRCVLKVETGLERLMFGLSVIRQGRKVGVSDAGSIPKAFAIEDTTAALDHM